MASNVKRKRRTNEDTLVTELLLQSIRDAETTLRASALGTIVVIMAHRHPMWPKSRPAVTPAPSRPQTAKAVAPLGPGKQASARRAKAKSRAVRGVPASVKVKPNGPAGTHGVEAAGDGA
jgi:hypothetical protein